MKKGANSFWIVVLLILTLSGYFLSYVLYRNNIRLEQEALNEAVDKIQNLEGVLKTVHREREISIEELRKSRKRIDALINEAETRDTAKLSVEEALEILEDLK